ncbi:MAG: chorismate synthase [Dehalococcoidia bacterium]|nr:chorismate synthase [Dehalococcoidia bacterium]
MGELRFLTAGESHGKGLTIIVEGMPAGVPLTEEYLEVDMRRRQGGYGRGGRQQIERDRAEVMSGVRRGLTLGSPIALWVQNRDWENWHEVMAVEPRDEPVKRVTRLRPGHADLAGTQKYLQDDVRQILERASARETAARVAMGGVARALLDPFGIAVHSHTVTIGAVEAPPLGERADWAAIDASPVRCHDAATAERMVAAIDASREAGDTIGGIFEVIATGAPIGLGSHVQWDRRLSGQLCQAVGSIHAIKGVEIGGGFALAGMPGSMVHDVILPPDRWDGRPWRRASNNAGGIEGGMTNGEAVVVRAAIKPIATLPKPLPSVDLATGEPVQAHYERSDICVVPAAGVIGESMVAMVLAAAMLEKFGGDHLDETMRNYRAYLETIGPRDVER